MAQRRRFEHTTAEPALVLFWPVIEGGLWDPEVSAMVDALEEDLEVFVTCVGRGRGALGLNDAASAVRFMGCEAMVVIAPDGIQFPESELEAVSKRLRSPVVAVHATWSSQALTEAYRNACLLVHRAA